MGDASGAQRLQRRGYPAGAGLGTLRAGDPLGQLAAPGEAQGVPRGTQGRLVREGRDQFGGHLHGPLGVVEGHLDRVLGAGLQPQQRPVGLGDAAQVAPDHGGDPHAY